MCRTSAGICSVWKLAELSGDSGEGDRPNVEVRVTDQCCTKVSLPESLTAIPFRTA